MAKPIRILQTTIPPSEDDWTIERFLLLCNYLASVKDEAGKPLCEVTARNRESNDSVLSNLDRCDFNELWLFAVDINGGLTDKECAAIASFRQLGGGVLVERERDGMKKEPSALEDIKTYARNLALWLADATPQPVGDRRLVSSQGV